MGPNIVFFSCLIALCKTAWSVYGKSVLGRAHILKRIIAPAERVIYRLAGVNPLDEMDWKNYSRAFLMFSVLSFVFLYFIQRVQSVLPFNPLGLVDVSRDLAVNTAVSFVSNTNWQNYGGETTMSFLTQMVGLTVQNFVSAATGMSVLAAFICGLIRQKTSFLGNFWVDMTRGILYILLPLAFIFALLLVSQGVVQTFLPKVTANLIQPVGQNTQLIAVGPAASQIAIKMLGTNGGGFFNVNFSHPLENPTPISNFLEMLAILLIPAALCYTYGKMIGDTRQGWAILVAMTILLVVFIGVTYAVESQANPLLARLGVDASNTAFQAGGNMEGKEVRFGITNSSLWAVLTTAASNGSVNSMHDSYSPLGGLVLLIMMMFGEVVFGGVGSGLYGMLVFVILAVFIAGLMVGRTPEYLGKKIEAFEIKMAALLILIMPLTVLGLTAIAVSVSPGQSSVLNPGPHGLSEILYAFTSQGNNNGSAFAGLTGNTIFYNLAGALAMLIGRFWLAIPTLALAGSLALKKKSPAGAGTLSTTSILFIGWLIGVIILIGALNFIPVLALGPITEHLLMIGG